MKKYFLLLTLTVSLILLSSCSQQPTQGVESSLSGTGDIKLVKVTADNVNVKTGCSANAPTLQTSSRDAKYNVLSKVADWYAVKLPDNSVGFVPENQCKPIVPDETQPDTTAMGANQQSTSPTAPKPQTNANSTSLTVEEQQMLKLINDARSQNNVPALSADMQLTNVARVKAQDMIDKNYFSHNSPTYGSPFDMMKSFGINYVKAGENIAGNQSVQAAHNALMNSPGHRKNILSPDYTHIGIGIKKGGTYGNMFTQMFVSKPR